MKKVNSNTSGRRNLSFDDRSDVSVKKPLRYLTKMLKQSSGRDSFGHISTRHKGGGNQRKYRTIYFGNDLNGIGEVLSIEYDPNRTSRIALIKNDKNKVFYITAPSGIKVGSQINFDNKNKLEFGNRITLAEIPTGIAVHNIEVSPDSKAKMVRSAGTSAMILSKDGNYANVKLPSGEVRKIHINCYASIGQVSNIEHNTMVIGKAGRKRHMGIRPTVRGKAMHPAAHPHGGGEGVNSIGMKYPKTPWGKIAIGGRTRNAKKPSTRFIIRKRNK